MSDINNLQGLDDPGGKYFLNRKRSQLSKYNNFTKAFGKLATDISHARGFKVVKKDDPQGGRFTWVNSYLWEILEEIWALLQEYPLKAMTPEFWNEIKNRLENKANIRKVEG